MAKRRPDTTIQVESSLPKRARFSIDDLLRSPLHSPDRLEKESANAHSVSRDSDSDDPEDLQRSTPTSSTVEASQEDFGAQPAPTTWVPAGQSPLLSNIECHLEGQELWARFYKLSTEMIITKSGRRMFPTVKMRLEGCDPEADYYVFLDIVPVDSRRYRYVYNKSAWLTAGKAETAPRSRLYMHPDSPFTGRQLATQVISFEKAKLTNNDVDRVGHLVLNSMHKYQPRVHVVRRERSQKPLDGNSTAFDLQQEHYRTFQFTETQFMSVTAYQNQLITKLKIEKNPFAKGFRDPTGRNGDICDIRHFMENLPMRPSFDPAHFFLLQQGWPPSQSLLDSTNLPKFFSLPFQPPANLNGSQCVEEGDVVDKDDAVTNKSGDTSSANNDPPRLSPVPLNLESSPSIPIPSFFPLAGFPSAHTSSASLLAAMFDPQQLASLLGGTYPLRSSDVKRETTKKEGA